ncbi:hypothetical protein [uncultured Imperialibacter sp.]|uniref:hypothetical protein n=1 Tax=uncultured Imperialibacter sp. TaxID=1672639 RepID=UPI0030D7AEF0|tara:strand:- start:546 stop:767 length:222 start_codon:yes stop_codon:yes gene_type:complete
MKTGDRRPETGDRRRKTGGGRRETGDRRRKMKGRRRDGEGHFALGPSDARGSEGITAEEEEESLAVNSECFGG